jgi:uncharacterized protein with FMN-binding domain
VKRIVLWVLSTLSTVVVLFGYHTSTSSTMATNGGGSFSGSLSGQTTSGSTSGSGSGSGATSSGGAPPNGSSSGSSGGTSSGSSSGASSAKTSTVTGDVAQTRWGPVQVRLAVSDSTITNVTILQYPNANGTDVQIANYALPQLIQETLDNQSASISMVSGATYTSQGYLESLQSALDQAGL